jgi:serine/threonine-protein kinase RsbW
MHEDIIRLSVPAEPAYARSVRMMASNLAVVCGMPVEDVEDVRMAAEEGFVYACATSPSACDIEFAVADGQITMSFALGTVTAQRDTTDEAAFQYAELILSATCDEYQVAEGGASLRLLKRAGAVHA